MALYTYNGKLLTIGNALATSADCCCAPDCPERDPYDCNGCGSSLLQHYTATVAGITGSTSQGCDCTVVNGIHTLCRDRYDTVAGRCWWSSETYDCRVSPPGATTVALRWRPELVGAWPEHWICTCASHEFVLEGNNPCDPTGVYTDSPVGWGFPPSNFCGAGGTCVIS